MASHAITSDDGTIDLFTVTAHSESIQVISRFSTNIDYQAITNYFDLLSTYEITDLTPDTNQTDSVSVQWIPGTDTVVLVTGCTLCHGMKGLISVFTTQDGSSDFTLVGSTQGTAPTLQSDDLTEAIRLWFIDNG